MLRHPGICLAVIIIRLLLVLHCHRPTYEAPPACALAWIVIACRMAWLMT
jgi:hypothetical protein